MLRDKQGGIKYHFWVFGMTRPGIKPRPPEPLANTQLIRPMARYLYSTSSLFFLLLTRHIKVISTVILELNIKVFIFTLADGFNDCEQKFFKRFLIRTFNRCIRDGVKVFNFILSLSFSSFVLSQAWSLKKYLVSYLRYGREIFSCLKSTLNLWSTNKRSAAIQFLAYLQQNFKFKLLLIS